MRCFCQYFYSLLPNSFVFYTAFDHVHILYCVVIFYIRFYVHAMESVMMSYTFKMMSSFTIYTCAPCSLLAEYFGLQSEYMYMSAVLYTVYFTGGNIHKLLDNR